MQVIWWLSYSLKRLSKKSPIFSSIITSPFCVSLYTKYKFSSSHLPLFRADHTTPAGHSVMVCSSINRRGRTVFAVSDAPLSPCALHGWDMYAVCHETRLSKGKAERLYSCSLRTIVLLSPARQAGSCPWAPLILHITEMLPNSRCAAPTYA